MVRKIVISLILFSFALSTNAFALLNLELTRGVEGAVPIAIASFGGEAQAAPEDVSAIVTNDLKNSGRFKVFGRDVLSQSPSELTQVEYGYFRGLGVDKLVIGKVRSLGGDRYSVNVELLDVFKGKAGASSQSVVLDQTFKVSGRQLRQLAHHISDLIYQQILGVKGIFSTRLAYVVVQRSANGAPKYILEVSDQDGYNSHPLLSSTDPIMSPAWSPNGREIAYVSFENRRASIYIEDVSSGSRRVVSQSKGINGAPAWSPDGRKLAVVLSKDGSPNIYVLDLASRGLTQLTHDFFINTEPSFSPNGRSLVFTSNRGGAPQIYQLELGNKAVSRVSYDGDYNARASFTADGQHIAMLHRQSGIYNIGILDLDSGRFRLLTSSGIDNESPSIAPNGSMVMFGTLYNGQSMLGMVSNDGKIQVRLPARNGEVQDPAWSPFLT
jgi:TolB protein